SWLDRGSEHRHSATIGQPDAGDALSVSLVMTHEMVQSPQRIAQILADEHSSERQQPQKGVFARISLSKCLAAAKSVAEWGEARAGNHVAAQRELPSIVVVRRCDRPRYTGQIVAPRYRMVAKFAVAM